MAGPWRRRAAESPYFKYVGSGYRNRISFGLGLTRVVPPSNLPEGPTL